MLVFSHIEKLGSRGSVIEKTPHGYRTSDLPGISVVQEAFDIAYTNQMVNFSGLCDRHLRFLGKEKEKYEKELGRQLREGEIRLLSHEKELRNLDARFDAEVKATPASVQKAIDDEFSRTHILPAQIILQNAKNNDPKLAAASMIFGMAYDDLRNVDLVTHVCGARMTEIVCELLYAGSGQNVDAYTQDISYFSPSAKTLYLAIAIGTLENHIVEAQGVRLQGAIPSVAPSIIQNLFDRFRATEGNEPALDAFYIDTFNRFCAVTEQGLKIDKSADGKACLISAKQGKFPPGLIPPGAAAGMN